MWHAETPKRLSKESTSHGAPNVPSASVEKLTVFENQTVFHTETPKRLSKESTSHGAPDVLSNIVENVRHQINRN